jgi:hypothetical protein
MWFSKERARQRLARETRLFAANGEGEIPICLIYPNRYPVGMSNLGFQAAYKILAQDPRCRCERAFLPDLDEEDLLQRSRTPLTSLESQRPLTDFELLAFSLSFETDYLHILDILALAHVPLLAREREAHHPLVIAGGPAIFLDRGRRGNDPRVSRTVCRSSIGADEPERKVARLERDRGRILARVLLSAI